MRTDRQNKGPQDSFLRLIAVLEQQNKLLQVSTADEDLLTSFKGLLRYLRSRPERERLSILGQSVTKSVNSRLDTSADVISDDELRAMTLDQVQKFISNFSLSRQELERIAAVRFGVTRGGLSTLHGRSALLEKLDTLVRNESTHSSIARVVEAKDKDIPK